MFNINNSGPNSEPCGTPLNIFIYFCGCTVPKLAHPESLNNKYNN